MVGIDELKLTKGKEDIDKELERVKEMFDRPGYFPTLDHLIHPEISLENFKYFAKRVKEMIGG